MKPTVVETTETSVTVTKPWNSILKTKPTSVGSQTLNFIPPVFKGGVLQIEEGIFEEGSKDWDETVVGFFLDKRLPYSIVKRMVEKRWNLQGDVEILLDGDLFYFNFSNPEDKSYV
ncbi:hypothetical protein FRX31_002456 [Thalictrum thalictroides]|uniref:DUF4283 domain-containing protein n=1 Tax=Thalictrum thalictroides TaxID=46969 RepID=A0A7J6XG12_THATH|nr:hypothetical protein FRX31_002456 [Thalictrum thalictroides]